MSAMLKFRFRWRADGRDHSTVIEAPNYPLACYELAKNHVAEWVPLWRVPKDFELDLTKPERVE
jgi:hypothetical protein